MGRFKFMDQAAAQTRKVTWQIVRRRPFITTQSIQVIRMYSSLWVLAVKNGMVQLSHRHSLEEKKLMFLIIIIIRISTQNSNRRTRQLFQLLTAETAFVT
jgi:flagellar biogenesis protein FliO